MCSVDQPPKDGMKPSNYKVSFIFSTVLFTLNFSKILGVGIYYAHEK